MSTTSAARSSTEPRGESYTRLVASAAAGWDLATDLMPTMRRLVAFDYAPTEVALQAPPALCASTPSAPRAPTTPAGLEAAVPWTGGLSASDSASRPVRVMSGGSALSSGSHTAATRAPRVPVIVLALMGVILSCGAAWTVKDLVASSGSEDRLAPMAIMQR